MIWNPSSVWLECDSDVRALYQHWLFFLVQDQDGAHGLSSIQLCVPYKTSLGLFWQRWHLRTRGLKVPDSTVKDFYKLPVFYSLCKVFKVIYLHHSIYTPGNLRGHSTSKIEQSGVRFPSRGQLATCPIWLDSPHFIVLVFFFFFLYCDLLHFWSLEKKCVVISHKRNISCYITKHTILIIRIDG